MFSGTVGKIHLKNGVSSEWGANSPKSVSKVRDYASQIMKNSTYSYVWHPCACIWDSGTQNGTTICYKPYSTVLALEGKHSKTL